MSIDWRSRYGQPVTADIDEAMEQLLADLKYESSPPRQNESVSALRRSGELIEELGRTLGSLSPVACGALHRHTEDPVKFHREDLDVLMRLLPSGLGDLFAKASDRLQRAHSPLPETGQGAGSAAGRDSDLRADAVTYGPVEFRAPKDKFAVRVVMSLCRKASGFDPASRGAAADLGSLLDQLWVDFRERFEVTLGLIPNVDLATPSWHRVVRARRDVAKAAARLDRIAARTQARNRQVSSAERRRRFPQAKRD